jgi:site-specific recombinase XerD
MMTVEGLTDNEAKVRDVYLFSCFTGLRFSDVIGLSTNNIVARTVNGQAVKVLNLIQKKTKNRVVIALNEFAMQILEKYTANGSFLPKFEKSTANRKIRLVAKKAGIDNMVQKVVYERGLAKTVTLPKYKCLTYHTSRHTFATQCLLIEILLLSFSLLVFDK